MSGEIDRKIVICLNCKGTGVCKWIENMAGHNLEQIFHETTCPACKGTGRTVQVLIETPFELKDSRD